jgi:predicted DNA-binding protein with PD1-like motif
MRYKKIESTYVIRLERSEKVIEILLELCEKEKIRAGYFNGLGAVSEVELQHFNLTTKEYSSKKLSGQYEITSLHGNVSEMSGKSYIHAHIVVGDNQFNSWSGHLGEATISATCEIFLVKLDGVVDRKKDEETGLNLLDI